MVNIIMSRREKFYRGKTLEELKKLEVREFAQLLKSREKRSVLRHTEKIVEFIAKCEKRNSQNKIPKTHNRAMVIVPAFVGMTVGVHNGKEFAQVKVTHEMIGHRFGEFSLTRRIVKHGAAGVGATKGSSSLSVK